MGRMLVLVLYVKMIGSLCAGRSSSAHLQLADEVTSNQQGHAYEEPNETESIMVPQPAHDIGPDSQDLSPPTRLPEVLLEERRHDNPDSQDERSPATQDERSPATQEVQADLSRGDSYSHYTCKVCEIQGQIGICDWI